jgi:hypothetical protein
LKYGADPNSKGWSSTGSKVSTFALFLFTTLVNITKEEFDKELYADAVADFLRAGAEFDDAFGLKPVTGVMERPVMTISSSDDLFSVVSGMYGSATVRMAFTYLFRAVLKQNLSEEHISRILVIVKAIGAQGGSASREYSDYLMGLVMAKSTELLSFEVQAQA